MADTDATTPSTPQQNPKDPNKLDSEENTPKEDTNGVDSTNQPLEPSNVYENKEKGKELYHKGDVDGAIAYWSKSIKSLNYVLNNASGKSTFDGTEETLAEYTKLYVALCLNLSLAYLKKEDYMMTKQYCNYVLMYDDKSVKAHLRIVQADIKLRNYERALANCEKGLKLNPDEPELKALKKTVESHMRTHKNTEKVFAKRVFESIEADPRADYDPSDDLMKSRFYRTNYKILLVLYQVWQVVKKLWRYVYIGLDFAADVFDRLSTSVVSLASNLISKLTRSHSHTS